MEILEAWLKKHALALVLCLSLGIALLLCLDEIVGPEAMPYGDGEGYARRALTLYGLLHSGQWHAFCQLYTLPYYSTLAPPQYLLFFLLPVSWASFTAYGVLTALVNNLFLALGIAWLCRLLERPGWTVPLFLLCATQNLTLDFSLFYFIDPTFLAFFTLSLAAQIRAWRENRWQASLVSGATLSLLYWIKPANALLYTFFFFLAELLYRLLLPRMNKKASPPLDRPPIGLRHYAGLLAGFFPLLACALATGGFQLVMRLLDANETSDLFVTHLTCTGLTRLLYFPLCFAYFYHAFLLLIIAGILWACWSADRPPRIAPSGPPFPWLYLLPLAASYFLFCEYFSLGMIYKTMRSVLPVLPLAWLLLFAWVETRRVRLSLLTLGVAGYVACAYLQAFGDFFHSALEPSESFQLEGDWLSQFPYPRDQNKESSALTRQILAQVRDHCPAGTKIAVNSERLFLTAESLSWFADRDFLLQGRPGSPYQFQNFISINGQFHHPGLLGAQALLLYTAPYLQYGRIVSEESTRLALYFQNVWTLTTSPHTPAQARLVPLRLEQHEIGFLILLSHPLTESESRELLQAAQAPGYENESERFAAQHNRYLNAQDCADILHRWYLRHFTSPPAPAPDP